MSDDELKRRAEDAINHARAIGNTRRREQDRIVDEIELALYRAKGQETIDALVNIARAILLPGPK